MKFLKNENLSQILEKLTGKSSERFYPLKENSETGLGKKKMWMIGDNVDNSVNNWILPHFSTKNDCGICG